MVANKGALALYGCQIPIPDNVFNASRRVERLTPKVAASMRWDGSLPPACNVPVFKLVQDDRDDGFDGRGFHRPPRCVGHTGRDIAGVGQSVGPLIPPRQVMSIGFIAGEPCALRLPGIRQR